MSSIGSTRTARAGGCSKAVSKGKRAVEPKETPATTSYAVLERWVARCEEMRGMVYTVSPDEDGGEKVDERGAQPCPSRSGASTRYL
jgi:hypothetical protein